MGRMVLQKLQIKQLMGAQSMTLRNSDSATHHLLVSKNLLTAQEHHPMSGLPGPRAEKRDVGLAASGALCWVSAGPRAAKLPAWHPPGRPAALHQPWPLTV